MPSLYTKVSDRTAITVTLWICCSFTVITHKPLSLSVCWCFFFFYGNSAEEKRHFWNHNSWNSLEVWCVDLSNSFLWLSLHLIFSLLQSTDNNNYYLISFFSCCHDKHLLLTLPHPLLCCVTSINMKTFSVVSVHERAFKKNKQNKGKHIPVFIMNM